MEVVLTPPPSSYKNIQKAVQPAFNAGLSSARQQSTWSRIQSFNMLAFVSLRVLQEGEFLRNVPLYTGT